MKPGNYDEKPEDEFDLLKGFKEEGSDFVATCDKWFEGYNFENHSKDVKIRMLCDFVYHDRTDKAGRDEAAVNARRIAKGRKNFVKANLKFYLTGIANTVFKRRSLKCRKTLEMFHYYLSGVDFYKGQSVDH